MNKENPFDRSFLTLAAVFLSIGTSLYAQTQPLTLAWDANPDASVAGYIVFVGNASGSYLEEYDVGNKTTFVYTNVSGGRPYFFAVAAYAPGRDIGPLSEEIFFLAGTVARSERSAISATQATRGTASSLGSQDNRAPFCGSADERNCYRLEGVASVAGDITALTPAGDGRLFFVDAGGMHIRVIANDTLMPHAALTADGTTRLAGLVLDPGFDRNRFVYVGEVETHANGGRELSIVRYREIASVLAEGAAIVTGLPLPPNVDAPFTIDGAGRLYVAMPGGSSAGSLYAGMVLRFENDGSVPRDSRGGSPVFAHGYARPTWLVWSSAHNELWLAGLGADWDGSLARLALAGNAGEWPRLPTTAGLDSDSPIVSLFSAARTARVSSASGGVSDSVILVDEDGTLVRIDAQTRRAASTALSTAEIAGNPTFAALDGNDIYVVVSPITAGLVPSSQILRLRQN